MAPRKARQSPRNDKKLVGRSSASGEPSRSTPDLRNDANANNLRRLESHSFASRSRPLFFTWPASPLSAAGKIKIEENFEEDIRDIPSGEEDDPDQRWIPEWARMDLNSALASQATFFDTCPRFSNSSFSYIWFFWAIQSTLRQAEAAATALLQNPISYANFKSLVRHFEDFMNTSRALLKVDLERIRAGDFSHCRNVTDFENAFESNRSFLDCTRVMASTLDLQEEWESLSHCVDKCFKLDRELGHFETFIPPVRKLQPAESSLLMGGPVSPHLLGMDYEFTDEIWLQWVEGCISYFQYWATNSRGTTPAEDFIRHVSHYRLAMGLFLTHKTVSDQKQALLLDAVKKYMARYGDYAATMLEKKYATAKENVKRAGIYRTEARFWDLAEDIEVLMNEPPPGIEAEAWAAVVPSMLPHDKVVTAKRAINVLYKEFQIKRYPEDEAAYLWLLTWRNVKHILPYFLASPKPNAIRQATKEPPTIIQARDLALPFVKKNLSQLQFIVQKDNDALYQKEIEQLVGDYCAHIDMYVQGKGKGHERIYEQFIRLSRTKHVPFSYLVGLEESLLKSQLPPTNGSQMVAHRVVMRLNHVLEGPRVFKRWELSPSGTLRRFVKTATIIKEEQSSLQPKKAFRYHDEGISPPSSSGQSTSGAANLGAGGDNDGDGGDKRNHPSQRDEEPSDSEEEVEVVSPGGTKRIAKRKKVKIALETLTNVELEDPESNLVDTMVGSQASGDFEEDDDEIMSGFHHSPPDILDYHRRRLAALRVRQRSAVPNAQYPLPETAASQRAAALQIAREMADPGIISDGPRQEDVQHYINPAFRLPLVAGDPAGQREVQQPHQIRRMLSRLRTILEIPFFGSPPRRSSPRATPYIPESNAQRERREREAREATPSVLKRKADKFSVKKSAPRNGRSRRSPPRSYPFTQSKPRDSLEHHRRRSRVQKVEELGAQIKAEDSGDDAFFAEPDLSWYAQDQVGLAASDESQTPSTASPDKNSNQENESPGKASDKENQAPTRPIQRARGNAGDWNSPSPPYEEDRHIYQGSPIRTPDTPTPEKKDISQTSAGRRLAALPPSCTQAGHDTQNRVNLNASPAGPAVEDGPNSQLSALNRWIAMEIASNNPDMRNAYQLHRELQRNQNANTINRLYEMLPAGQEMTNFNNYIFERNTNFGPEAHVPVRRGVPRAIDPPSTPEAQTDRFLPGWWDDRFEGAREGINRPAAAWAEPPAEDGEVQTHQNRQSGSSRSRTDGDGSLGRDSTRSPTSPPPWTDSRGSFIPWEAIGDSVHRDPLADLSPDSPRPGASNRAWEFRPHATTGLPEREFSIFINPDNRPSRGLFDLGEPLLVQDPLNPALLIPNPRFDPAILELISGGGRDDHGVIEVRVPPGWRINFGPDAARGRRGGAPSPSDGSSSSSDQSPPGDQRVIIHGPAFVIHEDSPSESGSVRDRSNAPPTLGLIEPPFQDQERVIQTTENDETQSRSGTHQFDQGDSSNTPESQVGGSRNSKGRRGGSKKSPSVGNSSSSSNPPSERNTIPVHAGGTFKSQSRSNADSTPSGSRSGSNSKTPSPPTAEALADPPSKAQTPAESSDSESGTEAPWYLRWESSTVVRLRDEVLRRGIPLLGLKLKQQLIDRLRHDDEENGVGGVYHPEGEEEEGEGDDEMADDDEDEEDDEMADGRRGGKKKVSGKKDVSGKKGGKRNDEDGQGQNQILKRARRQRRVNPFLYDPETETEAERARKRRRGERGHGIEEEMKA